MDKTTADWILRIRGPGRGREKGFYLVRGEELTFPARVISIAVDF